MRIIVHKYTEITDGTQLNGIEFGPEAFITNKDGKQWLVEVWA